MRKERVLRSPSSVRDPRLRLGGFFTLLIAVGGLAGLQLVESSGIREDRVESARLELRQAQLGSVRLAFERYRRESKDFRRRGDGGIAQAKAELRRAVRDAGDALSRTASGPEERELAALLPRQLEEFLALSARLEPTLFLKDVYFRDEARSAHEQMLATVEALASAGARRASERRAERERTLRRVARAQFALGGLVLLGALAGLAAGAWTQLRPLRRLAQRAREIEGGRWTRQDAKAHALPGVYGEIERVLDGAAARLAAARGERVRFVESLREELRGPLTPLRAAAQLLAERGRDLDDAQRSGAEHQLRRSAWRIGRVLEDLQDSLAVDTGALTLDEKVIDLREPLARVAAYHAGGPGSRLETRAVLPPEPVWMLVDAARIERVLATLVAKWAQFTPQGGALDLLLQPSPGDARGVEVVVCERGTQGRATGPEQDLLRHWVSENGFGLGLAQAVAQAHGGRILAAGVAGSLAVFRLLLPAERRAGDESSLTVGSSPGAGAAGTRPGLSSRAPRARLDVRPQDA